MKRSNRSTLVFGILGALVIAFLLGYAFVPTASEGESDPPKPPSGGRPPEVEPGRKPEGQVKPKKPPTKPRKKPIVIDAFDGLSGEDRKLAEVLQAAMESDDHPKIIAAAVRALNSDNPEVRREAVDALGWCGKDALAELTGLLADSDDDLRDSAINHWECALAEVEDPALRYKTAISVMGTITKSDALDSISGQFCNAAQEYIDEGEDEAQQNVRRTEVVKFLYGIIDGPTAVCAQKAKEAYNDLTGHDWVSAAEAEKYLANPDEYEPPED